MGQTCKRMHRMSGWYFRKYYSDIRFDYIRKKVRIFYLYQIRLRVDFYPYIGRLSISKPNQFDFYLDTKTFASLKTLHFEHMKSMETQIKYTQKILPNIENIELFSCKGIGNTFEQIASSCSKLKCMCVRWAMNFRTRAERAGLNTMLSQHYPKLEHLKFQLRDENTKIQELKVFLEKHLNLKHFECDYRFLWANRDLCNEINVQLDILTVHLYRKDDAIPFEQFVEFLKQLHARGFYKSLNLSIYCGIDDHVEILNFNNQICTLPALHKIYSYSTDDIEFSRLSNLKELSIFEIDPGDFEIVAENLTKLERLTFQHASAYHVLPFIRQSKRLKTVKVYGQIRDNDVLDLCTLNEERKRLECACQVTIHMDETIYLREKWKLKNLNLSHVKIARLN